MIKGLENAPSTVAAFPFLLEYGNKALVVETAELAKTSPIWLKKVLAAS